MIGIRFSNASRSHEGVVDRFVALENLAMHLALIVVSDLAARLREHGLERHAKSPPSPSNETLPVTTREPLNHSVTSSPQRKLGSKRH